MKRFRQNLYNFMIILTIISFKYDKDILSNILISLVGVLAGSMIWDEVSFYIAYKRFLKKKLKHDEDRLHK